MNQLPELPIEDQIINADCSLLTPCFLDGAKKDKPHLRPEAFIGLMHYWFRALHGHLAMDQLKSDEAQLFGNTSRRGSFSVSISHKATKLANPWPFLLPHKESSPAAALAEKQEFSLQIVCRDQSQTGRIESLFQLASLLGGVGRRSRRGAGSFQWRAFSNHKQLIESIQIACQSIQKSNDTIISDEEQFGGICLKLSLPNKPFNTEWPYLETIYIGRKGYKKAEELRKRISEQTHHTKDTDSANYKNSMGHGGRFASPVHASIIKIGDLYYPIISIVAGGDRPDIREHFVKNLLTHTPTP